MLDLLIFGGTVIDGTGRAAYRADIGVQGGKIAAIGNLASCEAACRVDASGAVVTPGFIDIHRHADAALFRPDFGKAELAQGLTTIVNGNCGLSLAPFGQAHRAEILSYLYPICGAIDPRTATQRLSDYFPSLPPLPLHVGMLVGAGTLRADAAGYALTHLEEAHYRAINTAMEQALSDGALGVSLGLGYAPECFYTTQELIRALSPLAAQNIPLTVHMRQEGGGVVDSVEEMLTVARALRLPLHISHLKAMGKENWGTKIPQALSLLTRARDEGLDVTCDVYPYTAGSTQLLHILPPDFLEGGIDAVIRRLQDAGARRALRQRIESGVGFDDIARLAGWDGIYLTGLYRPENLPYLGSSIAQVAAQTGKDPLDCCCDLLVSERCEITMIDFMASEEDIARILRSPLSNLISDATYPSEGKPHPRVYGAFPHLLEHFVREKGVLSLEEAVKKMTLLPAQALRLKAKGALAVGLDADINVFDPAQVHETGTYEAPCQLAQGIRYVIVGGTVALHDGVFSEQSAGTILKRGN